jgi:hypothetical protein
MCADHGLWVRFPVESFRSGSYKVAVSLTELLKNTNGFSKTDKHGEPRIKGCAPTLKESQPQEMYLRYNVKCSLSTSDANGHDVKVRFAYQDIESDSRYDNVDVQVSCTCKAFLYWGAQWNLHQEQALEGEARPLLQAPTERLDLRSGFLICKHVKVVLDRIIPSVQRVINDHARKKQVKWNEEDEARKQNLPKNITLVDDDDDETTVLPGKTDQPDKDSPLPYKPLFEQEEEAKKQPTKKSPVVEPDEAEPTAKPKPEPVVEPEPIDEPEPIEAEPVVEPEADEEDARRTQEEQERKRRIQRNRPKPNEGTIDAPSKARPNIDEPPAKRKSVRTPKKKSPQEDWPRPKTRSGVID